MYSQCKVAIPAAQVHLALTCNVSFAIKECSSKIKIRGRLAEQAWERSRTKQATMSTGKDNTMRTLCCSKKCTGCDAPNSVIRGDLFQDVGCQHALQCMRTSCQQWLELHHSLPGRLLKITWYCLSVADTVTLSWGASTAACTVWGF